MKTTWKKGIALLGGVMVIFTNLVPSIAVFAEHKSENHEVVLETEAGLMPLCSLDKELRVFEQSIRETVGENLYSLENDGNSLSLSVKDWKKFKWKNYLGRNVWKIIENLKNAGVQKVFFNGKEYDLLGNSESLLDLTFLDVSESDFIAANKAMSFSRNMEFLLKKDSCQENIISFSFSIKQKDVEVKEENHDVEVDGERLEDSVEVVIEDGEPKAEVKEENHDVEVDGKRLEDSVEVVIEDGEPKAEVKEENHDVEVDGKRLEDSVEVVIEDGEPKAEVKEENHDVEVDGERLEDSVEVVIEDGEPKAEVKEENHDVEVLNKPSSDHFVLIEEDGKMSFIVSFHSNIKEIEMKDLILDNGFMEKPADPIRSGYDFIGWFADKEFKNKFDFSKPITDHTTIYVKWNKKPSRSGGGGGGGSASVSSSTLSSTSSSTPSVVPTSGIEVKELVLPGIVSTPTCSIDGSSFSKEQNEAYLWACGKDITTMRAITGARLNDPLTRAELAKMMSVYVTQILGKDKVITGTVHYADVDQKLGDLADYVQLAYQLQIMGIDAGGKPLKNFMPHQIVTRAEFATVFSRVLWGLKHNQAGEFWYAKHLEALKDAKILTNTTPMMKEIRGWVLLMLHRSQSSVQGN